MSEPGVELARAVAQRIRHRRQAAQLSLEALADRAALHRTTLGLVERGARHLTLASAKRLADALGVPLWVLIREAEEARRSEGGDTSRD